MEMSLLSSSDPTKVIDEIISTFTVLNATLECLSEEDRWILVEKIVSESSSTDRYGDDGDDGNGGKVVKKMRFNERPVDHVKRVVLQAWEIQAEYRKYLLRKQGTVNGNSVDYNMV